MNMSQKYSTWQRGENFKNRAALIKQYNDIDDILPVSSDSSYSFVKTANEQEGECREVFNEAEQKVLGLITAYAYLTFNQIYTLLELMKETFSKTTVKRVLDKLIDLSVIVKYTVRSEVGQGMEKEIKIYSRSRFKIVRCCEIPNMNYKNRLILRSECGNSWAALSLTMVVVNQIVINQMIYGSPIRHLKIENVKYMPKCKIAVLLEMETDKGTYYFVSAMHSRGHKIQEILLDWTDYAMWQKRDFTLVFITSGEKNLVETMEAVNTARFFGFQIGYSLYYDWFKSARNSLIMRDSIR